MGKQVSTGSWVVAVVVVLALIGGGAWLADKAMHPEAPGQPPAPAATVPVQPEPQAAVIAHPIEQAGPAPATTAPLPALADSDAEVAAALARLSGGELGKLLLSGQLIPRIVASIDALPRHEGLNPMLLPARGPKGSFVTRQGKGGLMMAEANTARYAPYVKVIEQVDPQALVAWYVRVYPLFQQAYRELGYPKGYFNDRLIVVIDNLLATPAVDPDATLVPYKGNYVYSDATLERLSAGQKMLLRTGAANEAKIKAKLRAIRAALTAAGPHPAPANGM